MRIAYFTNQYPATSHTFIRREIAGLEARGHSVARYAIRSAPEPLVDADDIAELSRTHHLLSSGKIELLSQALKGIIIHPGRLFRALGTTLRLSRASKRGFVAHLAYLVEALIIAAWCRRDGIDHLHVHFGTNSATLGALVSELTKVPFSFTVHGPEEFDRPDEHSLRLKISRASFVVAVSSFGRSQLMRWSAAPDRHKLRVVHCGLDSSYGIDLGPEISPTPRFVCVARLSEQKGHFILLEAAAMLRDRGRRFKIVLVGDGPLRGELEATIAYLELSGFVQIAGWMSQPQVRSQILSARALVLPSFAEGLPVVLMESMALRRPVLSTYIAGIPELVDSTNGWLFPAGDAEALCNAMENAIDADGATMERMGALARAKVMARHDIAVSAQLLEQHMIGARQPGAVQPAVAEYILTDAVT